MKAILINAKARTVQEVEYDDNRPLESINGYLLSERYDAITINDQRDGVFIDDEGMFKSELYAFSLRFDGDHEYDPRRVVGPLVGRGLIIGCDHEGQSTEPTLTVEQVRKMVYFMGEVFPATELTDP